MKFSLFSTIIPSVAILAATVAGDDSIRMKAHPAGLDAGRRYPRESKENSHHDNDFATRTLSLAQDPSSPPVVNIIVQDLVAWAVDKSDTCKGRYQVTSVLFYQVYGFESVLTNDSRYQWIYHQDVGVLESVHCPSKVLDIFGSDCRRRELILYGLHGRED